MMKHGCVRHDATLHPSVRRTRGNVGRTWRDVRANWRVGAEGLIYASTPWFPNVAALCDAHSCAWSSLRWQDIADLRTELKQDIAVLRTDMMQRLTALDRSMWRNISVAVVAASVHAEVFGRLYPRRRTRSLTVARSVLISATNLASYDPNEARCAADSPRHAEIASPTSRAKRCALRHPLGERTGTVSQTKNGSELASLLSSTGQVSLAT